MKNIAKDTDDAALDAEHDLALVRRFQSGDSNVFGEIMARHWGAVRGVALNVLRDPQDADEIANDTFACAHRGLMRYRADCRLGTWLYRISHNLSCNRYWYRRSRMAHRQVGFDTPIGDSALTFADTIPCSQGGGAEQMELGEFTTALTDSVIRLPALYRDALFLRVEQEMDYKDIAAALGIEMGTVKSRIARGRRMLASRMSEKLGLQATSFFR